MTKKVFIGGTIDKEVREYIYNKNKETLVSVSVIMNEMFKKAIKSEK